MKNQYVFSTSSKGHLSRCHPDLALVLNLALKRSNVDFGIYESSRTIAEQQKYFNDGASSINPQAYQTKEDLAKVAKHIVIPEHIYFKWSRAVDIKVSESHNGERLTFDYVHLSYLAGVITSVAKELFQQGEITHIIRWGGDWDSDGVIALDHKLKDLVHFEIIKPY